MARRRTTEHRSQDRADDGRSRAGRSGEGRPDRAKTATVLAEPPSRPNEPTLRWSSRATSIAEIERELARIWADLGPAMTEGGDAERRIAARTSVMNLVVIARRPEVGQRAVAVVASLMGRHPSRTIVVTAADPDGPAWLDATVRAYCMVPRADAPETCADSVEVVAGGETGRHLAAIVAPLLVHDLPVTVWWPGEPSFETVQARDVLGLTDRLVVDGSTWSGDGLERLAELADVAAETRTAVFDFALVRQARWREAIASVFDRPEFMPYVHSLRRISVGYAAPDRAAHGATNVVKPVYHVAWLASRLGLVPRHPLTITSGPRARRAPGGLETELAPGPERSGGHQVAVVIRPVTSTVPPGTTLRVELLAERRASELRAAVTAEADLVHVRVWLDGIEALERSFRAPRLTEVDLLGQAIETMGADPITGDALRLAGTLARDRSRAPS